MHSCAEEKRRVVHACGHAQIINFCGSQESRDKWIATVQSGLCRGCWLKAQPVVFLVSRESITVRMGFPIRKELIARGYYFRRPNWKKHFLSIADRGREIAWIEANGFSLEQRGAQSERTAERVVIAE